MKLTQKKAARALKWSQLGFECVRDHRKQRGVRHGIGGILRLAVVAIATGAHSLRAVEGFGDGLDSNVLRSLGLDREVSDTCIYKLLSKMKVDGLAEELTSQVKTGIEQKVITNDLFPVGVVAMDGKNIWAGANDEVPEARRTQTNGRPTNSFVMAQRACLVSSSTRPVLFQRQIPEKAAEVSSFEHVYKYLLQNFGRSFEIITHDAGAVSRANAAMVNDSQRAYWFAIKDNQPTIMKTAISHLGSVKAFGEADIKPQAFTTERYRGNVETREAFHVNIDGTQPDVDFPGARQLWRIRHTSERTVKGTDVVDRVTDDRYFITNRVFSADKALKLARLHWGIENGPNWTMDVVFGEDRDGAPCTKGNAVEVWSWLRLLAYNLASCWRRKLKPKRKNETASWEETLLSIRAAFSILGQGLHEMSV